MVPCFSWPTSRRWISKATSSRCAHKWMVGAAASRAPRRASFHHRRRRSSNVARPPSTLDSRPSQGLIPPSIVELRSLRSLNLAQNFLVGSIPTLEGSLNRLRHLSLRNNSLGGSLYSKLPRGLETLNLSVRGCWAHCLPHPPDREADFCEP